MAEKISLKATQCIKKTFSAFVNLLKEFPRTAAGDFIYDDATIKKVKLAREALAEMNTLIKMKTPSVGAQKRKLLVEGVGSLSQLIKELPKDSTDEFLYDRTIHQLVEDARQAVVKLGSLIP